MPFSDNKATYSFKTTSWNKVSAVYGVMNAQRQMIYVGQTDDLQRRMSEHVNDTKHPMHRYAPELVIVESVGANETSRITREKQLIAEFNPPANKQSVA